MNSVLVTSIVLIISIEARRASFYTTFKCNDGLCQRTAKSIDSIDPSDLKARGQHTSLPACRLVCDKNAGLWPVPTRPLNVGKEYVEVHPDQFHFDLKGVPRETKPFLMEASDIFVKNLHGACNGNCSETETTALVHILVDSIDLDLDWNTREDYSLNVATKGQKITVSITASTVFGARHAFETLSQLTAPIRTPGGGMGLVILDYAVIGDDPIFPHRGLLIDTARNFLPVEDMLKTIDGLASTKMNVLHWHATDSQSFPIEMKSTPLMTKFGSYSPDRIYSTSDMMNVVSYAKSRGVRVILELDSPSHAGAGWNWGEAFGLGKLAVCVNQQPWRDFCIQPPCGQLNPVNPNTYKVLHDIYRDILDIWGTKSLLHLGGDELFINCWNATPEITTVMAHRGMGRRVEDFLDLWGEFHSEQLKVLDNVRGNRDESVILWSSYLTSPEIIERYLDKSRFVIQTWVENNSELPRQLLQLGYRLIISTKNTWYLDHGFWGRTSYHTWRDAYLNRVPRTNAVLGGEACMWGEYVNSGSLDSRVWPRAAAVAERLWSDPPGSTTLDVERRLQAQIERLDMRGIQADAIAPTWCTQHEQQCS